MTTEISIKDLQTICKFDEDQRKVYDGWIKDVEKVKWEVDTVTDIKLLESFQKNVSDRYKIMEQISGNFYLLKLTIDGRIKYLQKDTSLGNRGGTKSNEPSRNQ